MTMYEAATVMMGNFTAAPAYQEGLYTPERYLFYLAMQTLIYAQRKREGMLDYRAVPFYPPPDMGYYTKRNNEELKRHNKESKKSNIGIERNDNTAKQNNESKEPKTTIETNTLIEEDWITVKKSNIKTKAVREAIQKAYITNVKNRYKELNTNEEEMEEEDFGIKEIRKESVEGKTNKSYDINEITVEEMENYINKYKEDSDDGSKALTQNQRTNIEREDLVDSKDESNGNEDSQGLNEENDDDESIIDDDDDLMTDNEDSVDSFTIEDLNEEEQIYFKRLKDAIKSTLVSTEDLKVSETNDNENITSKSDLDIERILYQNELMLVRLEQAELNEDAIRKEYERNEERLRNENKKLIRENEEKDSQNKHKISCLEEALKKKTELLIAALKEMGSNQKTC